MTEATQTDTRPAKKRTTSSARKPRVHSGRTPRVPQQSSISTEPSAEVRLGDVVRLSDEVVLGDEVQAPGVSFVPPQVGGAYPDAVRRQRAATARGRRASADRPSNGPVEHRNVLDDLPLALRRLVVRTGDVRRVRQFTTPSGAPGIEMDLATARSLSLLP